MPLRWGEGECSHHTACCEPGAKSKNRLLKLCNTGMRRMGQGESGEQWCHPLFSRTRHDCKYSLPQPKGSQTLDYMCTYGHSLIPWSVLKYYFLRFPCNIKFPVKRNVHFIRHLSTILSHHGTLIEHCPPSPPKYVCPFPIILSPGSVQGTGIDDLFRSFPILHFYDSIERS